MYLPLRTPSHSCLRASETFRRGFPTGDEELEGDREDDFEVERAELDGGAQA